MALITILSEGFTSFNSFIFPTPLWSMDEPLSQFGTGGTGKLNELPKVMHQVCYIAGNWPPVQASTPTLGTSFLFKTDTIHSVCDTLSGIRICDHVHTKHNTCHSSISVQSNILLGVPSGGTSIFSLKESVPQPRSLIHIIEWSEFFPYSLHFHDVTVIPTYTSVQHSKLFLSFLGV